MEKIRIVPAGVLALGLLAVSCSAYAVDSNILGTEPSASSETRADHVGPQSFSSRAGKYWEEFSITLSGARTYAGYEAGIGNRFAFSPVVNQPVRGGADLGLETTGGYGYGGEIHFRPNSQWWSILASYDRTYNRWTEISDLAINPNAIEVKVTTYQAFFNVFPFVRGGNSPSLEALHFGIGIARKFREATITRPTTVVTGKSDVSAAVRAAHTANLGMGWSLDTELHGLLPFVHDETGGVTSGFYTSAWSAGAKAMAMYRVSDSVSLGVGAYYELEKYSYEGIGSRTGAGAKDVAEDNRSFGFPVELKFYL